MKSKASSLKLHSRFTAIVATVVAIASFFSGPSAQAANKAWATSGNANGNFSGTNWTVGTTGTTPPTDAAASSDALFFDTSAVTTLTNNLSGATFAGITFNSGASAYTIGGNAFTLSADLTNNSSSLQTISNAITLAAAQTITAGGNISLGGNLSGAATSLTKAGSGTLILGGTNTYTGATNINSGTLQIGGSGSLNSGSYAGAIAISSGATFQYSSSTTQTLTGVLSGAGNFTIDSGSTVNINGNNRLGITGALNVGGTLGVTGVNAQTVNASAINLTNGTLNTGSTVTSTFGAFFFPLSKAINASGASNSIIGSGEIGIASGRTLTLNTALATDALLVSATLGAGSAIAGGVEKTGLGTVTLSGSSIYTGVTTVTGGTLVAGTNSLVSQNGAFGNASSAVLLGNTTGAVNASILTNGAFTIGRAITLQSGNTGVMTIGGNSAHASIYSGAFLLGTSGANPAKSVSLVALSGGSVDFQGVINENTSNTGVSNITIGDATHTGTVKLSQVANAYSGSTTITNGATLEVTKLANGGSNSSIGDSSSVATSLIIDGSTLKYTGAGDSSDRLFSFTANGATIDASASANAAVNFTNSGSLVAASTGNRTLTLTGTSTGSNTLTSIIANPTSGATALTKNGAGSWTLGGINTYTGATTINAGDLKVDGSLAAGSAVGVNNAAVLRGTGTVNGAVTLNNASSLSSGSTLNLGSTLIAGGTNSITSGTVSVAGLTTVNNGRSLAVNLGATLSGLGGLTANGALTVNGLANKAVTVSNTGSLGGTGTIGGATTVSGILTPGNSPGTINFANNLTLEGNSTYQFELTGGGTLADLTNVTGDLILNNGTLDLFQLGTYTPGNKFTLFAYSGSITGMFASGSTIDDAGGVWNINYADSSAGLNGGIGTMFVTITAVPEPSTAALLAGGLLVALTFRRRSRSF